MVLKGTNDTMHKPNLKILPRWSLTHNGKALYILQSIKPGSILDGKVPVNNEAPSELR
jgi:hypothetical protein